jgi:hypothetical protein
LGGLAGLGGGTVAFGLILLLIALATWIYGMTNAYRTAEQANEQTVPRY